MTQMTASGRFMMRNNWKQQLHPFLLRFVRCMASIALVFVLLSGSTRLSHATESTLQKLEEARSRRQETQGQLNEIQQDIDNLNSNRDALEEDLDDLNNQLHVVSENIASLSEQITEKQRVIEETQAALDEATAVKDAQYEMMKLRVQFIYEKQQYVMTDMLMQSGSITDFLNQSSYIEAMSAYDREMLTQYRQAEEQIAFQKAQLEAEMQELQAMQEEQSAQQDRFFDMVVITSENIAMYGDEIALAEAEAEMKRQELAIQQAEIAELEAKIREEQGISDEARRGVWRDYGDLSFSDYDVYLLANIIYCEAGNQPYEGQVAVGAVVINRLRSSRFSQNTIEDVIRAPYQFSPVSSGRFDLALARNDATDACYRAARDAMGGYSPVGNCVFFRTPVPGLEGIVIGGHVFY